MGRLTTHVLDTAQGKPADGITVTLYRLDAERRQIAQATTNGDGRLDQPILEGEAFSRGVYELEFRTGAYFRGSSLDLPDPPFVDDVVLRFGIAQPEQHYHVPLLVSPWSYSTYRGS